MNERLSRIPEGTLYREPLESSPSFDFDAIIVHGKNWRKYPLKVRLRNKIGQISQGKDSLPLKLSKDSRNASVGIEEIWLAFKRAGKQPPVFIFSTGKTRGPNNPSEAEAMVAYMRARYPQIPDKDIVIEDRSYNTVGNILESKRIIAERAFEMLDTSLLAITFQEFTCS